MVPLVRNPFNTNGGPWSRLVVSLGNEGILNGFSICLLESWFVFIVIKNIVVPSFSDRPQTKGEYFFPRDVVIKLGAFNFLPGPVLVCGVKVGHR